MTTERQTDDEGHEDDGGDDEQDDEGHEDDAGDEEEERPQREMRVVGPPCRQCMGTCLAVEEHFGRGWHLPRQSPDGEWVPKDDTPGQGPLTTTK